LPNNHFPHLELSFIASRKHRPEGGRGVSDQTKDNKTNFVQHSSNIRNQSSDYKRRWVEKIEERDNDGLPDIPDSIPLHLSIDPKYDVDALSAAFKFEIISEQPDGYVIVTSDDEDLTKLEEKINLFERQEYGGGSVASIYEILNDDTERVRKLLDENLLSTWPSINDSDDYVVDVGVECRGTIKFPGEPRPRRRGSSQEAYDRRIRVYEEKLRVARQKLENLRIERETDFINFVEEYEGSVDSIYDDGGNEITLNADSFTATVTISGAGLKDLVLNYPFVFEVTSPEAIVIELEGEGEVLEEAEVNLIEPDDDAAVIGIIDSGIQEAHPLLENAIREDLSFNFIDENGSVADLVTPNGHGTAVAGEVLYAGKIPEEGDFKLPFFLANYKILNANNRIPENVQLAKLITTVISKGIDEGEVRVFNHSINSYSPCRLKYMSSWAAAIDKLSYEKDILVIQSAGNLSARSGSNLSPSVRDHLSQDRLYPSYLYESSCRIGNPGQSLSALTVGSIAHSELSGTWESFAKENEPSAFSRTGFGIWDTIKPDVVEYGGDYVYDQNDPENISTKEETSLHLLRSTRTPGAETSKEDVGTSFAAPRVTNIAGNLQNEYPEETTLLYKALIAQGARWPIGFNEENLDQERKLQLLRSYGYGLVDKERSLFNNDHRITLITSGEREIKAKDGHAYKVPIPPQLRTIGDDYDILIEVTLAFSSIPRRTRQRFNSYFATRVDWICSRKEETEDSFKKYLFKEFKDNEYENEGPFSWFLGDRIDNGQITDTKRNNSCLQKDWAVAKSYQLPEEFFIGVRGRQGWSLDPLETAKYSLVVSFEAINKDIDIYNTVKNYIENISVTIET
jgi:subtilisin family serine protease